MFILTSITELQGAIERARELHPKVRMVEFGEYEVTGSRGNTYRIFFYRRDNQKIVDCMCPTKDGIACKHAAAALPLHIHMARERQLAH